MKSGQSRRSPHESPANNGLTARAIRKGSARLSIALCKRNSTDEVVDSARVLAAGDPAQLYENYLALCQVMVGDQVDPPEWIQLIPSGKEIEALDGRKFSNPNPDKIIQVFRETGLDLPIDLEHASEIKAPKGEPAPAAGWIVALQNRNGSVWAQVKWTDIGDTALRSKHYRYVSPGFYHNKQGEIVGLSSAGLVNKPALKLQELATARVWSGKEMNDLPDSAFLYVESGGSKDDEGKTTPRSLRHFPYKDSSGAVDLDHLRNALSRIPQSNLPEDVKKKAQAKASRILDEQKSKATASYKGDNDMDAELKKILGLAADADDTAVMAKCRELMSKGGKKKPDDAPKKDADGDDDGDTEAYRAKARIVELEKELATARAQVPDLRTFVPRQDYDKAIARISALEKDVSDGKQQTLNKEVEEELKSAVKAGKITPATIEYYRKQCGNAEGLAVFRDFIKAAPVVAPDQVIRGGKPPRTDGGKLALTSEERTMIAKMGMSEEEYRKGADINDPRVGDSEDDDDDK